MNEKVLDFVRSELSAASDANRQRLLRAVLGYLQAARDWRASQESRRHGEYQEVDRDAYRFDIDCARVEP